MNLLGRLALRMMGMASPPGPTDSFWYNAIGTATSSGERVTAAVAEQVAAVHRGKQIIAEGVAKMPCELFKRLPKDRREEAPDHPFAPVLRLAANETDTPIDLWDQVLGSAVLRGRGYAEMIPGPRTFADQLVFLPFDTVEEKRFKGPKKRLTYVVRRADGEKVPLGPDRVFRLCGPDGGKSLLDRMRETVGSARAAEAFGGEQFSKAPMMAGILSPKAGVTMTQEALLAAANAFREANSGPRGRNRVAVLPGLEYHAMGMTLKDAQFLELRKFSREEIAIFLGVPPHKLGVMDKASYASVEAQNRALVDDCLQPWATRLEQAIAMQILAPISVARGLAPDAYFVKFNFDELLRGTMAERAEAESKWIMAGVLSQNECREMEDRDPIPGLDKPLVPASNARPAGDAPASRGKGAPPPDDDEAAAA